MEVSSSPSPGMPVAGFGLGTIDQAVPFQCSIRVSPSLVPTAQALSGLRSSTPDRVAPCAGAGSGTCTRVQVVPFQCSASGSLMACWFSKVPTAQASAGPEADTLARVVSVGPAAVACGLTVGSTFQIEPTAGPPAAANAGWVTPAETSAAAATAAAA